MAQWAKVPTIKPGHLSAIPQTYTVDEENQIPKVVLCPPHVSWQPSPLPQ